MVIIYWLMRDKEIKEILARVEERLKTVIPKDIVLESWEINEEFDFNIGTSTMEEIYEETVVLVKLSDVLNIIENVIRKNSRRKRRNDDLDEEIENNLTEYVKGNGVIAKSVVIRETEKGGKHLKVIKYYVPEGYFPFIKRCHYILWEEEESITRDEHTTKKAEYKNESYYIAPYLGLELFEILSEELESVNVQNAVRIQTEVKVEGSEEKKAKLLEIIKELSEEKDCAKVKKIIEKAEEEKMNKEEVTGLLIEMRKQGIIYESKPECFRIV